MAPTACPRCRRANPSDARFCHYDGAELDVRGGKMPSPAGERLAADFVFGSGRRCHTFDEIVDACLDAWGEARQLLYDGVFRNYLSDLGRPDLANAAEEAEVFADGDIGLNHFLKKLPAKASRAPKLDLQPRRLDLGTLRVGEMRSDQLTVYNQGRGLLVGTLTVAEGGDWLSVALVRSPGDGPAPRSQGTVRADGTLEIALRVAREQQIMLLVDTTRLTAAQRYHAKLTLITNGGVVEVPVRLAVAATPFPDAPLRGAEDPRDLAERMQQNPKAAAPLLHGGAVARWFAGHGWHYPVQGPTADGVAAVQQFFEALGLARAPTVRLAEPRAEYRCTFPEIVRGNGVLQTRVRKWIYAWITSNVDWVKVVTPYVSGPQQVAFEYEIDSSLLEPERVHEAALRIEANAGQKLTLRLRVHVQGPELPFTRRLLRPFLTGALGGLALQLLGYAVC
jgi:hypothetical protein